MKTKILTIVFIASTLGIFAQVFNFENKEFYTDTTYKIPFTGLVKIYDENGRLMLSGQTNFGKKNGLFMYYYPSGKLYAWMHYKDNLMHGQQIYYSEAGKVLLRASAKDGKKEGSYTYYYPTGKIQEEGFYKNDIINGEWTEYYENGRIKEYGKYLNGAMSGIWFQQDETGPENRKRYDYDLVVTK